MGHHRVARLFLERNPSVKPRLIERFEPWYGLALIRFNLYQLFVATGRHSGIDLDELHFKYAETLTL